MPNSDPSTYYDAGHELPAGSELDFRKAYDKLPEHIYSENPACLRSVHSVATRDFIDGLVSRQLSTDAGRESGQSNEETSGVSE